jgi:hypothetical protein
VVFICVPLRSQGFTCEPQTITNSFLTVTNERAFVPVPFISWEIPIRRNRTILRYWEKQAKVPTTSQYSPAIKGYYCASTGVESSPLSINLIASYSVERVAKLKLVSNSSRFVTASAGANGSIVLTGWQIAERAFKQTHRARDTGYPGSVFALSETVFQNSTSIFTLAYRDSGGNLALTSWAQAGDTFLLRGRVTTTLPIRDTKLMLLSGQNGLLVTGAIEAGGKKLLIDTWTLDGIGALKHLASGAYDIPAGSIQDISMALEGGLPSILTTAISGPKVHLQLWEINTTGTLRVVAKRENEADVIKVELAPRGWGTIALVVEPPAPPLPISKLPATELSKIKGHSNQYFPRWLFFTNWWEGLAGDVSYHMDRNHTLSGTLDSALIRIYRGTGNTSHPNLITAPQTDVGWLNRHDEQFHGALLTRGGELYWLSATGTGSASSRNYSQNFVKLLSNEKSMRLVDLFEIAIIVNYTPSNASFSGQNYWPTPGASMSSGGSSSSTPPQEDTLEFGVFSCTGTITNTNPPYSCSASLGTDTRCTMTRNSGAIWCPAAYTGCSCTCSLGTCPQGY